MMQEIQSQINLPDDHFKHVQPIHLANQVSRKPNETNHLPPRFPSYIGNTISKITDDTAEDADFQNRQWGEKTAARYKEMKPYSHVFFRKANSSSLINPKYREITRIDELLIDDYSDLGLMLHTDVQITIARIFGFTKREMKRIEDHKKPSGERFLEVLAEKRPTLTINDLKKTLQSFFHPVLQPIIDTLEMWTQKIENCAQVVIEENLEQSNKIDIGDTNIE